jgi:hypothetical protein
MGSGTTGSRASPSTSAPGSSSGRCSTSARHTARARRLECDPRKQTLRALDMRARVNREEFFGLQHGDDQLLRLAPQLRSVRSVRSH